jgi:hypothetical protein
MASELHSTSAKIRFFILDERHVNDLETYLDT